MSTIRTELLAFGVSSVLLRDHERIEPPSRQRTDSPSRGYRGIRRALGLRVLAHLRGSEELPVKSRPQKPAQLPLEAFQALQGLRVARDASEGAQEPARAYDRARNALASRNQGLVVRLAQRWVCAGAELEDLVQEGVLGLLDALERFDVAAYPTHTDVNKQFCTFAAVYINGAIARSRPRNTLGRLSMGEHTVRYAECVAMEDSKDWKQSGESQVEAKAEEKSVASESKSEKSVVSRSRRHAEDTLQAMRAWKKPVKSLDSVMVGAEFGRDESRSTLHDRLSDETQANPEEEYAAKEQTEALSKALKSLDPAEARVLGWRFGLGEAG